ncbi:MAG: hypothetical protein AAF383_15180 [Cyanobacteria bacterium P01_A01_bin.83]
MKNLLATLAIAVSGISLFGNGYLFSQVSELKTALDSLTEVSDDASKNIAKLETSLAETNQKLRDHSTVLTSNLNQSKALTIAKSGANSDQQNQIRRQNGTTAGRQIKPGEYVATGYENQVEFELLSANRIVNPKTNQKGAANCASSQKRLNFFQTG